MENWQEWIGYLASALVALSLLMSSVKKLRWINMAGAAVFTVYGLLIDSWPVVIMNAFLVVVNIWYLFKLSNKSLKLRLKPEKWDNEFVQTYMDKHQTEINSIYPGFNPKDNPFDLHLIYNQFEIAGFFSAKKQREKVRLNTLFLSKKFRNCNFDDHLFKTEHLILSAYQAEDYEFSNLTEKARKYLRQYNISL